MRGPAHLDSTSKITPQTATRSLPAVTAPELRYPQEACELKDDVLYRTWVLLAKNVPATIEKLREQNLDPVQAVEAVDLPRRKALSLVLYAIDTDEFLKSKEQGREVISQKLTGLTKSENHQEIRVCNREGDRGRSKVERSLRRALFAEKGEENYRAAASNGPTEPISACRTRRCSTDILFPRRSCRT